MTIIFSAVLIVALAAALIMVVSKYGFSDVTTLKGVALDPSRIWMKLRRLII